MYIICVAWKTLGVLQGHSVRFVNQGPTTERYATVTKLLIAVKRKIHRNLYSSERPISQIF